MTPLSRREWAVLILLILAGIFLCVRFALPRYEMIELKINQSKAVALAKDYLASHRGIDARKYQVATVFYLDSAGDRYLQKTIGTKASKELLQKYDYDMFCWAVRFFKEKQKEEFKVTVSSKTGEIIGFAHDIEDTAARPVVDKEEARHKALEFLQTNFVFNPAEYIVYREDTKKFDNRENHTFVWQHKTFSIPWDKEKGGGEAKLLTTVTVSGSEILVFSKSYFEIPDAFNRYIINLKQTGENLTLIFRMVYMALLTVAIMIVVNRKHYFVPRIVKPFYVFIGIMFFISMLVDSINGYQFLQYNYPTAQSFADYVMRQLIEGLITPFFIILAFILPGLAGESLRFECWPAKKTAGFLSPVLSSFATRPVARQISLGYGIAIVLLGVQSLIFELGHRYLGVWDELSWLTQASTAVFPALTALFVALHASFAEEITFRLFAINLFKKYGLPTLLGVVLSSLIWGFGHAGYLVFPMWFRGVEVSILGLILGAAYLRFGLITVISAHFLMDAILGSLPYLLEPHLSVDFVSSLGVVLIPAGLALAAWQINRPTQERPMALRFNRQQEFNYGLLQELVRSKDPAQLALLKQELLRHGWDPVVVERAMDGK